MTLFFETGHQAVCFLAALPLGFLIAACLCWGRTGGFLRLAADIVFLACGGTAMVVLLAFLRDDMLRMYHVLGALIGAILYLCGCNSMMKRISARLHAKKSVHMQESSESKTK